MHSGPSGPPGFRLEPCSHGFRLALVGGAAATTEGLSAGLESVKPIVAFATPFDVLTVQIGLRFPGDFP